MQSSTLVHWATLAVLSSVSVRAAGAGSPSPDVPAASGQRYTVSGASVVGSWRGTKIENDSIHGGYITLNFAFTFSPDGNYQETAYLGAQQVMSSSGQYKQSGNTLTFIPQQCNFASPDVGQRVKLFPVPTDSPGGDTVSFSPLEGGSQISLKEVLSGEQWGLKPGAPDAPRVASGSQNSFSTPQSSSLAGLPGTDASAEAVFRAIRTPLEVEFYNAASPAEKNVMLDRALKGAAAIRADRGPAYEVLLPDASAEAKFKNMATADMMDLYNMSNPENQLAMQRHAVVDYTEHRLGITLTEEQEAQIARTIR